MQPCIEVLQYVIENVRNISLYARDKIQKCSEYIYINLLIISEVTYFNIFMSTVHFLKCA